MNEPTIRTRFPIGASFLPQGESRVRIVEAYEAASFSGAPDALMLIHQKQGFWPSECRSVTGGQSAEQPAVPTGANIGVATLRAQLADAIERERLRQLREQQLETERQAQAELRERESLLARQREATLREELNRERVARLALDAQSTEEGRQNLIQVLRGVVLQIDLVENAVQQQQQKLRDIRLSLLRHITVPIAEGETFVDESSPYLNERKLTVKKEKEGSYEPHNNDSVGNQE